MAYQFKLQVPISEDLNQQLKTKDKEIGFSSVNEIARLLLTNFANGNIFLSFMSNSTPSYALSPEEQKDLESIVAEGIKEYKEGKTKKLDFSKPLTEQLIEEG